MTLLQTMRELNEQTPDERYDLLKRQHPAGGSSDLLLLSLYNVDQVVRARANSDYYFYIQEEGSLFNLLGLSGIVMDEGSDLHDGVLLLDISKLIYRFTCAKKFRVPDKSSNQLRLNSWGRSYVQERRLTSVYRDQHECIRQRFVDMFSDNEPTYRALLGELRAPITAASAHRIQAMNSALVVKLLS